MSKKEKILKKSLKDLFFKLKIKKGSKIILHSNTAGLLQLSNSKKSLDFFFQLLLKTIGKSGTLVIPTYNYDFTKGKVFDKKKSPSQIGIFGNYMIKKYFKNRTNNPIFSHLVFGKDFEKLIGANDNDVFGNQSFFSELERLDFLIVCFCCSPASITFSHYIENKMKVNYRFKKKFEGYLKDKENIKKIEVVYNVGKKNVNYSIKEKNLLKLVNNRDFLQISFGRFYCYSVKTKYYSKILQNKIKSNVKFLIKDF